LQGLILSLRLLDIRVQLGRDRGAKSRFPAGVSHELANADGLRAATGEF
jgi:hypothetical protein